MFLPENNVSLVPIIQITLYMQLLFKLQLLIKGHLNLKDT